MNVLDIVKGVLITIQNDSLVKKLESESEVLTSEETAEVDLIVNCINLTIQKIATNYIPLIEEVSLKVSDGIIPYSSITQKQIFNILSVRNNKNQKLLFEIKPTHIVTGCGDIVIKYTFIPKNLKISDNIDCFKTKISERIMLYGVLDEYLLMKGNFSESDIWNERFLSEIRLITRTQKLYRSTRARRWH